jgi:cytochrome c-type biogenesis protein
VILGFAGNSETVTKGVLLLWVYSLGLAVPFLLTSLAIDRFMAFYGRFRRYLQIWEVGSGVVLILIGVLILTRRFAVLSSYLGFLNRFTW